MPATNETSKLKILIPQAELQRRITEIAAEISRDYAGSDRLVAVGVLKGSLFFLADLLKQVTVPLAIDFFQTSSYGGTKVAGEVRIKKDIDLSIRGADVLLVEDIVDTGWTVRTILDLFRFRGAKSVKLCALLDKYDAREVEVPIGYCGFPIPNRFVVGFGLDWDEKFRNLPYIGVVESGPPPDEEEGNR